MLPRTRHRPRRSQFRGEKLACERIYWDHATVLRQVGLLREGR
jgi:hypothetical protein